MSDMPAQSRSPYRQSARRQAHFELRGRGGLSRKGNITQIMSDHHEKIINNAFIVVMPFVSRWFPGMQLKRKE